MSKLFLYLKLTRLSGDISLNSGPIQNNHLLNKNSKVIKNKGISGPNLDLLFVMQLDAAASCENYAKLYFDAKHLEKRLN